MPDAPSLPDEIAALHREAHAVRDRLVSVGMRVPADSRLVRESIDDPVHSLSVAALKISNARAVELRRPGPECRR